MKQTIAFDIDDEIARKAESVYNALGMNTEMALSIFMRRTVLEGALPLSPVEKAALSAATQTQNVPSAQTSMPVESRQTRSSGVITQEMADVVWDTFLKMHRFGGSANSYADEVTELSGMNVGSAFIYLVMLDNMVAGKPNTRNMKIKDLEGYVARIKDELGQKPYENTLASLEASLEYWSDSKFGHFATRVQEFLESQKKN